MPHLLPTSALIADLNAYTYIYIYIYKSTYIKIPSQLPKLILRNPLNEKEEKLWGQGPFYGPTDDNQI